MNTQNFYGPVDQVAGGDIHNANDFELSDERRRMRWDDLVARQQEHIRLREAAESRMWLNWYVLWIGIGFLATVMILWEGLLFSPKMPFLSVLVAVVGLIFPVNLLHLLRKNCVTQWTFHNQAVGDINSVLNVL